MLALFLLLAWTALAGATPFRHQVVDSLNEEPRAEAHQRDDGATMAVSDVKIKVRHSPDRQPGRNQLKHATDVGRGCRPVLCL